MLLGFVHFDRSDQKKYLAVLSKIRVFSIVGISIVGGTLHNVAQCAVGTVFIGLGAIYYLPLLLVFGALCGAAVGFLSSLILRRIKNGE